MTPSLSAPPTHWLYHAAAGGSVEPGPRLCALCACACADSSPIAAVLPDTFTNHGMARAPSSRDVCPACAHYYTTRWLPEGFRKPAEYRLLSLAVTPAGFAPWPRRRMRVDVEGWLASGFPGGVLVVSLAKKKHLLPLAAVNPPGRSFTLQLEEQRVRVSPGPWAALASAFDALLAMGCGKGEVLTGRYSPYALRRLDLAAWRRAEAAVAPARDSAILSLISYVTLAGTADDTEP